MTENRPKVPLAIRKLLSSGDSAGGRFSPSSSCLGKPARTEPVSSLLHPPKFLSRTKPHSDFCSPVTQQPTTTMYTEPSILPFASVTMESERLILRTSNLDDTSSGPQPIRSVTIGNTTDNNQFSSMLRVILSNSSSISHITDGVSVAIPAPPIVPLSAVPLLVTTSLERPLTQYDRRFRSERTPLRPFPLNMCIGISLNELNKQGVPMSQLFDPNHLVYDRGDTSLAILGAIATCQTTGELTNFFHSTKCIGGDTLCMSCIDLTSVLYQRSVTVATPRQRYLKRKTAMKTEFENASFDNITPLSGGADDILSDNIPVSKRAALLDHTVQSIILDWQCPTCSLWFAAKVDRSKRERHLRIHTGVRHLACQEPRCGEMFSDTSDRNVHYHSVHLSAPKKIECSFCGGHYAYKYSLDRHMIRASHPFADCVDQAQDVVASTVADVSNPKLFVCREPKCGCTFTNQGNCFHHYRFSHTVLKKVRCAICGANFSRQSRLRDHMLNATHPLVGLSEPSVSLAVDALESTVETTSHTTD